MAKLLTSPINSDTLYKPSSTVESTTVHLSENNRDVNIDQSSEVGVPSVENDIANDLAVANSIIESDAAEVNEVTVIKDVSKNVAAEEISASTNSANNSEKRGADVIEVMESIDHEQQSLNNSDISIISTKDKAALGQTALSSLNDVSQISAPTSLFPSSTPASSNGIITIDDDEDIVITQVIRPVQPVAATTSLPLPHASQNADLLKLASKIKNIVDPTTNNEPKLKQLQETLAALIKNKQQQSAASSQQPPTRPVIFQPSQPSPPVLPQRQLQSLLQRAITQRTHQQLLQQQQSHQLTPRPPVNANVVQQILQAVMNNQQAPRTITPPQRSVQMQRSVQPVAVNNVVLNRGVVAAQPSYQQAACSSGFSGLQSTLKMLQDQLKAKYNSQSPESQSEFTSIISNIMKLNTMKNNNHPSSSFSPQLGNPSGMKLKSPSLLRQIQHAQRPKQPSMTCAKQHNYNSYQQKRKVPLIDLSQNIPVVYHSKEKLQFLAVVGLVTRQQHQKIVLSHPSRKRRIEQARMELDNLSLDHTKKSRKRRRKGEDEHDGDTHENYCAKCRMAGELLMCDKCPRVYHLFCLVPPLKQVPDGEWYCSKCQAEKDAEESMDVNVTDVMDDPGVDQQSRNQIEELHRQLLEMKRARLDLESHADIT